MEDRHVTIILEKIRSDFRAFGDGLVDVNRQLKDQGKMIAQNTEDITMIRIDINYIKNRINELENRVTKIEKQMNKIGSDIKIMKADLAFVKKDLKKFVHNEEYEALEKRVIILEHKISQI